MLISLLFFFQAEDGIRDKLVTGVQTCALPISPEHPDPHALLPVLPGTPAGVHGLEFVLRPQAVPLRRTRTRSPRRLRRRAAPARADAGHLSVLVPREEDALLLGAHVLRGGTLSLDDDGRTVADPECLQLAVAHRDARPGMAVGAGAPHALRVRVSHRRGRARPRGYRSGAPAPDRHW